MKEQNKKPIDEELDDENDEIYSPISEQVSHEGEQTEDEFTRGLEGQNVTIIEDSHDKAKIKISEQILDTKEDKYCEMTYIPRSLVFARATKETFMYITDLERRKQEMLAARNNNGNKNIKIVPRKRAMQYFFERLDRLMRSVDGNQLKRATLLAGDEAREKEPHDPFGGFDA